MNESANAVGGLRLGLIGCGNMGAAIFRGVAQSMGEGLELRCSDKLSDRAEALALACGATYEPDHRTMALSCDMVILAVKPKDVLVLLRNLEWPERPVVLISVVAGVRLADLNEQVPPHVKIVRCMPNTPALVNMGITAILRVNDDATQQRISSLFACCGAVVVLNRESEFDAVTALSGSGPAYTMLFAEALADGGVKMGLSRPVAQQLALHTIRGAAELAIQSEQHPAQLRDAVSSPGGTTIYGLAELERQGVRGAVIGAVEKATKRSRQLGKSE